jgi:hypothetical protein
MRRAILVRVDETDGHYRRLPRAGKHVRSTWRVMQKTLTHTFLTAKAQRTQSSLMVFVNKLLRELCDFAVNKGVYG